MKKLVSLLLALAMILCLATTAFATETVETYKLTLSGIKDHTYKVFQIYTGEIFEEENGDLVITDVKYGKNHYPVDGMVGDPVLDSELKSFVNSDDPANYFKSQIKGDPYKTVNSDRKAESVTIDVAAGYYLIVDVTTENDLPDGQTKSPVLLKVAEETTIHSKHASILSEKKVYDVNDSGLDADNQGWHKSADYDIGDKVPFQLSVTIPVTYKSYDNYTLTFHDKQTDGFDDPADFEVYVQDKNGAKKFDILEAKGGNGYQVLGCTSDKCEFGGCSFTVQVGDLKELYGENVFAEGDTLVVKYNAELNSNAHVGRDSDLHHNENAMYVCHPDGHTPQDFVSVLTYKLKFNKVDGSNNPLAGAGFTLYKWDASLEAEDKWVAVGSKQGGKDSTVTEFKWTGLDGGKYKLEETDTPDGYNSIADMEFVIDANHKLNWTKGGNSAFMDLIAKDANGNIVFADAKIVGEASVEDGILEGEVVNHKGAVLPETGAKGTIMLIGTSSLLVMVAAVFMITRKKMSIYED